MPDDHLGAGPTVFDQAHLRFLQHTIADAKIKVRGRPTFALPAYFLGSCSNLQGLEASLVNPAAVSGSWHVKRCTCPLVQPIILTVPA